jgi:hypothetical protein
MNESNFKKTFSDSYYFFIYLDFELAKISVMKIFIEELSGKSVNG